jgi:hypothetical protein
MVIDGLEAYSAKKAGGPNGGKLDCGGSGNWKDRLI